MNILGLTYDQVFQHLRRKHVCGAFQVAALYRAVFQNPHLSSGQIPAFSADLPLAKRIQDDLRIDLPQIVDTLDQDGVLKWVLELSDGLHIEAVALPMPRHVTLCISSQVGCRMGCRFCRTGQMGLQRPLSADEIVGQVYLARLVLGLRVRNVVFMGMGEPLDNLEAVVQAIRVLTDQRGLDLALRRITLSTIGLVSGLRRLSGLGWPQLGLAISLNAAENRLRQELMPATGPHALGDLKRCLQAYPLSRGRVFFISYVLIKDINDSEAHARDLASFLAGLPVKINLIPYNPGVHSPYQAPSPRSVERFRQALVGENLFVRLRGTKGERINAACGQLSYKFNNAAALA